MISNVEKLVHVPYPKLHLRKFENLLDDTAEGAGNQAPLAEGYQGFISLNVRKPNTAEWHTFTQAVVDEFSNFDNTAPAITADQVSSTSLHLRHVCSEFKVVGFNLSHTHFTNMPISG